MNASHTHHEYHIDSDLGDTVVLVESDDEARASAQAMANDLGCIVECWRHDGDQRTYVCGAEPERSPAALYTDAELAEMRRNGIDTTDLGLELEPPPELSDPAYLAWCEECAAAAERECGAEWVGGPAHDPYGSHCDLDKGHGGPHSGPNPLGEPGERMEWDRRSGRIVREPEQRRSCVVCGTPHATGPDCPTPEPEPADAPTPGSCRTAEDLALALGAALTCANLDAESDPVLDLATYADAGVLTSDAGFLVRYPDGREYQVTIIQSRHAY